MIAFSVNVKLATLEHPFIDPSTLMISLLLIELVVNVEIKLGPLTSIPFLKKVNTAVPPAPAEKITSLPEQNVLLFKFEEIVTIGLAVTSNFIKADSSKHAVAKELSYALTLTSSVSSKVLVEKLLEALLPCTLILSIKNSYSTPPDALKLTIVPSQILADAFNEFAEAKPTAVI